MGSIPICCTTVMYQQLRQNFLNVIKHLASISFQFYGVIKWLCKASFILFVLSAADCERIFTPNRVYAITKRVVADSSAADNSSTRREQYFGVNDALTFTH